MVIFLNKVKHHRHTSHSRMSKQKVLYDNILPSMASFTSHRTKLNSILLNNFTQYSKNTRKRTNALELKRKNFEKHLLASFQNNEGDTLEKMALFCAKLH